MKKRTELDKEVSRLQKNARNKLYRLRKKGAINAQISAAFNPVIPAVELKGMSDVEKRQYAQKLREFNARENAYIFKKGTEVIIQPEGTNILSTELWQRRLEEAELNVIRAENAARLKNIRESVLNKIPASQVRNIDFVELPMEYAIDDGRFSAIKSVIRKTDFKPGEKSSYEKIKSRITTALDTDRLLHYKQAVINKLRDNDIDESVLKRLSKLTADEMAYLHFYTDFGVIVDTWQYEAEYENGHRSPSAGESNANETALKELLQFIGK
jgi:hypothetical protein